MNGNRVEAGGDSIWAVVLAAGEGTRLRSLTTTRGGLTIPKQFCSLRGGASLLEEAIARAAAVSDRERILSVVAAQHRRWWQPPLRSLASGNVVVQPANKGTAAGLLLPLLHIAQRDPDATIVVLPADHHVRDEPTLARTLRQATRLARVDSRHVYLLGLEPDQPDPELGYIVPGVRTDLAATPVSCFVEKPAPAVARDLVQAGALWNVFILAATARALLGLYAQRHASLVADIATAARQDWHSPQCGQGVARCYPDLPVLDFSRDVLQGQESALRVLTLPACGWSDLGTPHRVAATLSLCGDRHAGPPHGPHTAHLSLADQHSRQQLAR